jgi:hypothetical protein
LNDHGLTEQFGRRRTLLTLHQGVGLALVGLMTGTMVSGQLSYNDRFGGPSTGRFETTHSVFATGTLLTFAGAGALAFFAPVPMKSESEGINRITVHKWSMLGATIGMAAQAGLGIYTASREGYLNQSSLASTHLVVGYATLALMATAVGALVF